MIKPATLNDTEPDSEYSQNGEEKQIAASS